MLHWKLSKFQDLKNKAKVAISSWLIALWLTQSPDVEAKWVSVPRKWRVSKTIDSTRDYLYELLQSKNLVQVWNDNLNEYYRENYWERNNQQKTWKLPQKWFKKFLKTKKKENNYQQNRKFTNVQVQTEEFQNQRKVFNNSEKKKTYKNSEELNNKRYSYKSQQKQNIEERKRSFSNNVNDVINNWKWLILNFNWKKYDLSIFENKVLKPLTYSERFYWRDFNEFMVLKLWFIENMWRLDTSEKQFWRVLKKFEWHNYRRLQNVVSHAWAKWVFQIMDRTRDWLNRLYNVDNIFNQNYHHIKQKFWLDDFDMEILRNATYSAFTVEDIWKYRDHETISWMYNMWPKYLKVSRERLNSETRWYIEKHRNVDDFLKMPWMIKIRNNQNLIFSMNDQIDFVSNQSEDNKFDIAFNNKEENLDIKNNKESVNLSLNQNSTQNKYSENVEIISKNTQNWINWILNYDNSKSSKYNSFNFDWNKTLS